MAALITRIFYQAANRDASDSEAQHGVQFPAPAISLLKKSSQPASPAV